MVFNVPMFIIAVFVIDVTVFVYIKYDEANAIL